MSVDPYKLLLASAVESVGDTLEQYVDEATGDSPIEKLFLVALRTYCLVAQPEYFQIHVGLTDEERIKDAEKNSLGLYVNQQVQIDGLWRVDFLIQARNYSLRDSPKPWRRLIVECDGHDFHERTKEQAAIDRSRDRTAQGRGYEIYRFTGSELWREPWEKAEQVLYWASGGL